MPYFGIRYAPMYNYSVNKALFLQATGIQLIVIVITYGSYCEIVFHILQNMKYNEGEGETFIGRVPAKKHNPMVLPREMYYPRLPAPFS